MDSSLSGPSSETIRQMGDKITAKSIVTKYGIDGVPGFDNELPDNEQEILKIADEIGYPLIVKATAGGGGRGMKIVRSSKELINSVQIAKQEALNGFGNDIVYFENPDEGKYVGWVYTTANEWRRFGNVSLSDVADIHVFNQVGIATTTPGANAFQLVLEILYLL